MSVKKVVVVFGATGAQGGSVIRSILGDSRAAEQFAIRGITRDPDSAKAKALIAKGVECVKGDLNSEADLHHAFQGAYAVYGVTNYWETQSAEAEIKQGKNIADAAKAAGVQHLIWSSLLNITELTHGKFKNVEHFDSKATVEQYIRSLGIPATFFMPGFYMSNISGGMMHPNPASAEHELVLAMPTPAHTPIPLFDADDDAGKFVKAILLHRNQSLGKRVLGASAYYTCAEIVSQFGEVKPEAGRTARFEQLPDNVFKQIVGQSMGLNERGQIELLENMQFMTDFGYYGGASLDESHKILDEKVTTWKEFVAKAPQFKDLK